MLESPTSTESIARQSSADLEANLEALHWQEWSEELERDNDSAGLLVAAFWMFYGMILGVIITWVFLR
jgi:hypothetical protein